MACSQMQAGCPGVPNASISIVETKASRTLNGFLTASLIAGVQLPADPVVPEEGIYIIYKDRAVQIAGPHCKHLVCEHSFLCFGKDNSQNTGFIDTIGSKNPPFANSWYLMEGLNLCNSCAAQWLGLSLVDHKVRVRGFGFLEKPKHLQCRLNLGRLIMNYDEDFRLDTSLNSLQQDGTCPPHIMRWILDAWNVFLRDPTAMIFVPAHALYPIGSHPIIPVYPLVHHGLNNVESNAADQQLDIEIRNDNEENSMDEDEQVLLVEDIISFSTMGAIQAAAGPSMIADLFSDDSDNNDAMDIGDRQASKAVKKFITYHIMDAIEKAVQGPSDDEDDEPNFMDMQDDCESDSDFDLDSDSDVDEDEDMDIANTWSYERDLISQPSVDDSGDDYDNEAQTGILQPKVCSYFTAEPESYADDL